jgi:hypothetical protein
VNENNTIKRKANQCTGKQQKTKTRTNLNPKHEEKNACLAIESSP